MSLKHYEEILMSCFLDLSQGGVLCRACGGRPIIWRTAREHATQFHKASDLAALPETSDIRMLQIEGFLKNGDKGAQCRCCDAPPMTARDAYKHAVTTHTWQDLDKVIDEARATQQAQTKPRIPTTQPQIHHPASDATKAPIPARPTAPVRDQVAAPGQPAQVVHRGGGHIGSKQYTANSDQRTSVPRRPEPRAEEEEVELESEENAGRLAAAADQARMVEAAKTLMKLAKEDAKLGEDNRKLEAAKSLVEFSRSERVIPESSSATGEVIVIEDD
ncbi:MAG: hypothetical protein M1820_001963 [Bogoriella megaspora]|nr:MAG: hypothetical protein M1820_001963 [Bogoriella megaspora]